MAKVKGAGHVAITFDGNALTAYVNQASMQAAIDSIDVTDFASTAKEWLTGFADWTIPLSGHWDPTLDGYLAPDAITPGTKKTAVVALDDGSTTITYTWSTAAEIDNFTIDASNPSEAITWSANLKLSGAPARA